MLLLGVAGVVVALAALAIGATIAAGQLRQRAEEQDVELARTRSRLELAELEALAARGPRLGLPAAARAGQRTKPLPPFIRHADTRIDTGSTDATHR